MKSLKNSENPFMEFKELLGGYCSGHRRNNNHESLYDHLTLTKTFFLKLYKERKLDKLFGEMKKNFKGILKEKFEQDILTIIFLHDIGKVNEFSQKYYRGDIKKNEKNTNHAEFSMIVLLSYFWEDIKYLTKYSKKNLGEKENYALFLLCLIYSVKLHHTSLEKITNLKYIEIDIENTLKEKEIIQEIFKKLKINFDRSKLEKISLKSSYFNLNFKRKLFFNIKLFYSCLVLSDYYAAYSYQFNRNIDEISVKGINTKILNIMEKNFHKISYNSELSKIDMLQVKDLNDCKNINELRNNLIIQATKTLHKYFDKKIFTLNVPTGGGKTNISLKLALEILKRDKNINRIHWVFPYVNIIEQNYNVLKKHYFDNKDVEEYLAKISYDSINISAEDYINYDENIIQLIESDLNLKYLNNPINVISNINFFNSFFKAKKTNRYKCVNFVNSVVVIDEIQTISTHHLNIFYNILKTISEQYNIYFIIMSATLPDPNNYIKKDISVELIENYKDYFNHKAFKRNEFIFESERIDENSAINYFKNKITEEFKEQNKFLIVFNTIRASINLFKKLKKELGNYKVFLLNSYVDGDTKNKIINYIKNTNEKIVLVSTQSIEAGVDLDFDIGFRDDAILDSIEQVAGRINRECKKKRSKLFIFNYKTDASIIYKKDKRYNLLDSIKDKIDILNKKDFSKYYNLFFDEIRKDLNGATIFNYFDEIEKINFKKIGELNLIDNLFSINLISNKINTNAFDNETNIFLNKIGCQTIMDLLKLIKDKKEFKYKPYINLINKIINKNSFNLSFFNEKQKINTINFLRNNNYILKQVDNSLVVNKKFYNRYLKQYGVGDLKLSYLDILNFKEDVGFNSDSAIII